MVCQTYCVCLCAGLFVLSKGSHKKTSPGLLERLVGMSQEVFLELLPDHHFYNPGFTSSCLFGCDVQLVPGS